MLSINRLLEIKNIEGNVFQSDDVMFPNKRVQKLQIDQQKFGKFVAQEFFLDSDEIEKELEENVDDINYDQVP